MLLIAERFHPWNQSDSRTVMIWGILSGEKFAGLPDGRKLAYLDLGDPAGHPVIHAHGAPSGKLETAFFDLDAHAERAGVRLLAIDRPGVGGSTPAPERTLLSWAGDVAAFANALHLDRFGLFGYSIGAGSTLACLHRLSDRLTGVAIVSGAGSRIAYPTPACT